MRRKFDEPLRKKLSRLEANGKLYVALAEGSEVPYLSMPLKRPQDIETSWDELLAWHRTSGAKRRKHQAVIPSGTSKKNESRQPPLGNN